MSREDSGKDPSNNKRSFNEAFDPDRSPSPDELEKGLMTPYSPDSGASSAGARSSSESSGTASPASSDSGTAGSSPDYVCESPIVLPPNQKVKYQAAKIRAQGEIKAELGAKEAQDRIIGHNPEEYDTAKVEEVQKRIARKKRLSRSIDFESSPPPANCKPGRGPGRGGGGGDDPPPPPAPLGGGGGRSIVT